MGDSDSHERRLSKVEKLVALLDQRGDHLEKAINGVGQRIDGINEKKLTPMAQQLNDLHHSIYGSKGFWAGVFLTVSALWAIIATFGVVMWQWFKNGG